MALELRKQGGTYRRIADVLRQREGISPKYDHAAAYLDVQSELQRLNRENQESANELRRLQHEQLTELYAKYHSQAAKGDMGALDRILAIMDRMAKLYGLYATNVNVAGEVKQTGTLTHTGSVDLNHSETQVVIYIPDNGRGDAGSE